MTHASSRATKRTARGEGHTHTLTDKTPRRTASTGVSSEYKIQPRHPTRRTARPAAGPTDRSATCARLIPRRRSSNHSKERSPTLSRGSASLPRNCTEDDHRRYRDGGASHVRQIQGTFSTRRHRPPAERPRDHTLKAHNTSLAHIIRYMQKSVARAQTHAPQGARAPRRRCPQGNGLVLPQSRTRCHRASCRHGARRSQVGESAVSPQPRTDRRHGTRH